MINSSLSQSGTLEITVRAYAEEINKAVLNELSPSHVSKPGRMVLTRLVRHREPSCKFHLDPPTFGEGPHTNITQS